MVGDTYCLCYNPKMWDKDKVGDVPPERHSYGYHGGVCAAFVCA